MKIGFTGTRKGLTDVQRATLRDELEKLDAENSHRVQSGIMRRAEHPDWELPSGVAALMFDGATAEEAGRIAQGEQVQPGTVEFHHGDCVGADAQAHQLVRSLYADPEEGWFVVTHPPTDPKARAWCGVVEYDGPGDQLFPKPYLERNHAIVDATDCLIACPDGPERERSGTWATVRYARRRGKRVVVIMPDGELNSTPSLVK